MQFMQDVTMCSSASAPTSNFKSDYKSKGDFGCKNRPALFLDDVKQRREAKVAAVRQRLLSSSPEEHTYFKYRNCCQDY